MTQETKIDVVAILQKTTEVIEKDEGVKLFLSTLSEEFVTAFDGLDKETVLNAICVGFAGFAMYGQLQEEACIRMRALSELDKNLICYECELENGEVFGLMTNTEMTLEQMKENVFQTTGEKMTDNFKKLSPEETQERIGQLRKELNGEEDKGAIK